MEVEVTDNRERHRWEVTVDGDLAGHLRYEIDDGRITLIHTEVEPEHKGEGLGKRLAAAALEDARERGLAVAPLCPFVASYIREHPDEHLRVVVPELRDRFAGEA